MGLRMSAYPEKRLKSTCTIGGVTFELWQTGIAQHTWRSTDGKIRVWDSFLRNSYNASVQGKTIGSRYRSKEGAMKAAVAAWRKGATP